MFEQEAIKINLREDARAIKKQLKDFKKEASKDYNIEIPENLEQLTSEEFHVWIMGVKDSILKAEENLVRKTTLVILLESYLKSAEALESLKSKQSAQNPLDMA